MRPDNDLLRTINAQRGERSWPHFLLACAGVAATVALVAELCARRLG